MTTTKDVLDNHLRRFHEGNIEGILDDYTADAILFTPAGTLTGRNEIKTLFQRMLEEFAKPGASDTVHTASFEGDYAYLVWSAETHVFCAGRKNRSAILRCEDIPKTLIWSFPRARASRDLLSFYAVVHAWIIQTDPLPSFGSCPG